MKILSLRFISLLAAIVIAGQAIAAQTKNDPKPTPLPDNIVKRNERPKNPKTSSPEAMSAATSTHFYEFVRPGFTYSRILIEHDDEGKGKISFVKDDHDELLTDPILLSKHTLSKITEALIALKFLDSSEEYQHARDYSHMGNVTFTLSRMGRSRTIKFNWTDNASAKAIMDEYRRISNEYTWRFEMQLARENLPLQTPGLMEALDGYLKRNEISDPSHMLPMLTHLSMDERLPLMARNRASKLIKEIEKIKK